MTKYNLRSYIYNFKTKYKQGFTKNEVQKACHYWKVDYDKYAEKLGVHTAMIIDDEIITYHSDVELGLRLVIENRGVKLYEFD